MISDYQITPYATRFYHQSPIVNRQSSIVRLLSFAPLHLSRTLYKSTLFMQNKPNFQDTQMNVSIFSQMDYEKKSDWTIGQNKPNSNPNKPNFKKAKMNVKSLITKDYIKKDDSVVRINKPNSNPISQKAKMNVNLFTTKDYENEPPSGSKKTNPNKPNFFKGQNELKIACQKIRPHPCRLSYIFGLQFGLIVAKYSEICNHRFISNNKAVQRAEQCLSFAIDVVK